jgi:hypothetical protein
MLLAGYQTATRHRAGVGVGARPPSRSSPLGQSPRGGAPRGATFRPRLAASRVLRSTRPPPGAPRAALFDPGPRFPGRVCHPDQPSSWQGDRSVPRAEPRAAPVRGHEPRAEEPHPTPLKRRLMTTPSVGWDENIILISGIKSTDLWKQSSGPPPSCPDGTRQRSSTSVKISRVRGMPGQARSNSATSAFMPAELSAASAAARSAT